ncbi:MAG TPA: hypothetical protein VK806_00035 [Bacteroidia bacterium]|jgi:hypothetical protein|nr:hypothetical protein [Bacteroidia bacterium]
MEQITFTITEEEVQQYSKKKLSKKEIIEILVTVQNDQGLWIDIENSIRAAIESSVTD